MAETTTDAEVTLPSGAEADAQVPPMIEVTPEEGRRLFDDAARQVMGMSGEEFIRRWEAGEYWGIADADGHRHIGDLISIIPFARQEP